MQTKIIRLTKKNQLTALTQAAAIIKSGGLVVFPTETVYGLGANALEAAAVKKIFIAKGRPSDNPIIVHIFSKKQLLKLVNTISPLQEKLMKIFWPGPLTIIFKKKNTVPSVTSGGLATVAIRMPSHPVARELIKLSGTPIAAPSANASGSPSATAGEHAFLDLEGRVDFIIDAGFSDIGLESTVVSIHDGKILILRPGIITKEMLEKVVYPGVVLSAKDEKDLRTSPGTKYKHYAPKAKVEIFKSEKILRERLEELKKEHKKVGILPKRELGEASKNLYRDLRALDAQAVDVILCEAFPEEGIGIAFMDRLKKAAQN